MRGEHPYKDTCDVCDEYYQNTCDFCRRDAKYRCICGKAVCEDCTALCDVCEDTFCKECVTKDYNGSGLDACRMCIDDEKIDALLLTEKEAKNDNS